MSKSKYCRRSFLAGIGGSLALLPLLHTDRTGAQEGEFPKRLVLVTWPNGVPETDFYPSSSAITIGETLASLTPWQDKLTILQGLDMQVMVDVDKKYNGHQGYQSVFTGRADPRPELFEGMGISVDQFIADEIATREGMAVPPLLNVAVEPGNDTPPTSWRGEGQRNVPETDPYRLFDRLFAGEAVPPGEISNLRLRRGSVLDHVGKELESFGSHLGTEDRFKIEAHLQSIRELEKRLGPDGGGGGIACTKQDLGPVDEDPDTPKLMDLIFDLSAAALQCDHARVVNITLYNGGGDGHNFPWLDINEDYHDVAHELEPGYHKKQKIDGWIFSKVARLIQILADTTEGSSTALDNSVVVTANNMGYSHDIRQMPFTMTGSCAGYFKTGHAINFDGKPHNQLLTTLCNAMDIPATSFGENYEGSLPELLA